MNPKTISKPAPKVSWNPGYDTEDESGSEKRSSAVVVPASPVTPLRRLYSIPPDAETSPNRFSFCSMSMSDTESGSDTNHSPHVQVESRRKSHSPHWSLPLWNKCLIVFVSSFTTLSVTLSSTNLFPLTPEISQSLATSERVISVTNSLTILVMGFSIFIWGPISRTIGRKYAWITACLLFILCTVGTALAPENSGSLGWQVFVATRILSGVEGTFFHVAGQTWLADIFEPTQRGRATGCFLVGTIFGPSFGPCIAGIMVKYTSWRGVLWLQTAMVTIGLVASIFFLPDIRRSTDLSEKKGLALQTKCLEALKDFNPTRVFKPMIFPNIIFTHISAGLLSWCQYSLLASPRRIISERFHIDDPVIAGLFYIALGLGFILGTTIGGKLSDNTVIRWMSKRESEGRKPEDSRMPQDRLNSGKIAFFFIIPVSFAVYGWGLEYEVGGGNLVGLVLPMISGFFCAFGVLVALASVNTYCAEAIPKQRSEVIAGKYVVQYTFAAAASGGIVPLIDEIGIGAASMISIAFSLLAGGLTLATARYGERMERAVLEWKDEKKGLPY